MNRILALTIVAGLAPKNASAAVPYTSDQGASGDNPPHIRIHSPMDELFSHSGCVSTSDFRVPDPVEQEPTTPDIFDFVRHPENFASPGMHVLV